MTFRAPLHFFTHDVRKNIYIICMSISACVAVNVFINNEDVNIQKDEGLARRIGSR